MEVERGEVVGACVGSCAGCCNQKKRDLIRSCEVGLSAEIDSGLLNLMSMKSSLLLLLRTTLAWFLKTLVYYTLFKFKQINALILNLNRCNGQGSCCILS